MSINYLCHNFHTLLNERNFEAIKQYDFNYLLSLKNNSIISLILQYGIYTDNQEIINRTLPLLSRRRDYFHYIAYNKQNKNLCEELFLKYIPFDSILPKDITFLIENDLNYLLRFLDGHFITLDFTGKMFDTLNFKRYSFVEAKDEFNKISSKVDDMNLFLTTINNHYEHIIDAGNIMYSRKGEFNENSVTDLEFVINKFKNSLIIIHTKHLKNNKIKKILAGKLFFATPYKYNDDIFTVMAYLHNPCKIISNDTFKDHTIENNKMRCFIFDDLIKYSNNNGVFTFDMSYHFTRCIQVIDKKIYIPALTGFIELDFI